MRFILIFTIFLLPFPSVALDKDKCTKYAAKAKSDWGARLIYSRCISEKTSFYNRTKEFKCAMKTTDANSDTGAKLTYSRCINK